MISAVGGLMSITGEADGDPVRVGVAVTDVCCGLHTHGAILAALFARERDPKQLGQKIDSSLLESQVSMLVNAGSNYLVGGADSKRYGTAHASIVPYQAFKTKDGYIAFGALNDVQFCRLCEAIGDAKLAEDPQFKTNPGKKTFQAFVVVDPMKWQILKSDNLLQQVLLFLTLRNFTVRVVNRKLLIQILQSHFQKQPTAYWEDKLEKAHIPFGPINTIKQVFNDPQVLHRKMLEEIDHPTLGKVRMAGIPVKYSLTKPSIRLAPPQLGEHTKQILNELLNYPDSKIKELSVENVIKTV